MNRKVLFGIFLPLAVIIAVIVMNSRGAVRVEKEAVASVPENSLFKGSTSSIITLQTITMENNHYLVKSVELPPIVACLNDKEGVEPRRNLNVWYSEQGLDADKSLYDDFYTSSSKRQLFEVAAYGRKEVKILAQRTYYDYPARQMNGSVQSSPFDEVLLFELKRGESSSQKIYTRLYNFCQSTDMSDVANVYHIEIVKGLS
ncbi:MAG: hypothetical protein V1743_05110 [Nanoarchaeota archaeon]